MYQLPSAYRPADCSNITLEFLAAPAVLEAYKRLSQEAQRTLEYYLPSWAHYEHDKAHLSQIHNDLQEDE
ncbi:hypothetical protein GGI22_006274, partial [Coemansia erecta]